MRRLLTFFLLFVLALQGFAATVPVTRTQNAVSGVVQAKMAARGFAVNDPRYTGALLNIGSSIAAAAVTGVAITAAGVTAPAWVTAGVAAGLGSALTYAFSLAANSAYKWLMNSDGTVTTSGIPTAAPNLGTDFVAMTQGGSFWRSSWNGSTWSCGSPYPCVLSYAQFKYGSDLKSVTYSNCSSASNCAYFIDIKSYTGPAAHYESYGPVLFSSGAPASCAAGSNYNGTACAAVQGATVPPTNLTSASLQSAVNNIPAADLAKPADSSFMAALINQLWKNAAQQPGYSGAPYVATDPVTAADVAAWQASNPSAYPTVGDLVSPQPAPSGATAAQPFSLPLSTTPVAQEDPATQTQTGTNPAASNPLQNLGTDPGIGAPTLETTPTAQAILAPILNLMPSLKNFVVPNHTAQCPKPTIAIFGKSIVMDAHCNLLDGVRNTLFAVMAFVWLIAAMFIVLRA
jgi:hypothetical protein